MATPLEIVQGAFAAFARADIPGILELLCDDVVWEMPGPDDLPFAGRYVGKRAVNEFFRRLLDSTHIVAFQAAEFISERDKVAVFGTWSGCSKSTGKPFGSDFLLLFSVSADKIAGYKAFYDTANAAAAFAAE